MVCIRRRLRGSKARRFMRFLMVENWLVGGFGGRLAGSGWE